MQHLEGGIVEEILVADGDSVDAGQTLIVLDDTAARAALDLLEGQHRLTPIVESLGRALREE